MKSIILSTKEAILPWSKVVNNFRDKSITSLDYSRRILGMNRTSILASTLIASVVAFDIARLTSTYSESFLSSDSTTISWVWDGGGNGGGDYDDDHGNWWQ